MIVPFLIAAAKALLSSVNISPASRRYIFPPSLLSAAPLTSSIVGMESLKILTARQGN
jgi:hypothetical protein